MPVPKFQPCIPVSTKAVPTGPDWLHEVKYDGYRGRVDRDGNIVRVNSKSGLDWTWRFPWIVESALRLPVTQFAIDGEICVLDVRGISDFDALHSNRHNEEAKLYAFDLVALDGDDLRELPLFERKGRLAKLLARRPEGIFVAPFERGEIGPDLFRAACDMGLEGLVSKHRERRYRPKTCDWVKVKNRAHPAYRRVADQFG
ncbi:bifunctional non-homologous end joining protein LigD [Bradyrhizobium elkanii]|uniref:ATP-dependent DNA ligase n=1 Tax=Bradyrhizobium elkanii TaxID=29448 RepID=UPI000918223A|nr:ATP-dependent DNA ligase [Bradyrhizobium elkanii]NWL67298.1 DNA ligase [Bradyrhizobium elkanii]OIM94656.1 DNA ligase [Bradyrhizobium elkanii]